MIKCPKVAAMLAVFCMAALSGCATNKLTGRSQFMLVSEQSAIAQSASAYSSLIGSLSKDGKISKDSKLAERIQDITDRLITQAVRYRPDTKDWKWTVEVIDDPKTVNAFCMAGGKMAIYTGLIEQVKPTDDEIAEVMGHEISHALAGHQAEKMSVQLASGLAVAAITAAGNSNNSSARYEASSLAAMTLVALPNSRTQESEADRLGIELAARAGYNPHAAVTLWQKMMKASGQTSRFDLLSTHPASPKRMEALAALEAPMTPIYEAGKANRNSKPVAWVAVAAAPASDKADTGSNLQPTTHAGKRRKHVVAAAKPVAGRSEDDAPQLSFFDPEFEKFKAGKAKLACGSCETNFYLKQEGLKELYDKQDWHSLALQTMRVGYRFDLAYYYLGTAAMKLGFSAAASSYYEEAGKLAQTEDYACAKARLIKCFGIDVARTATASR